MYMYILNLPLLVLKARHLSGSAFCTGFSKLEVPEQALDGLGIGCEDKPSEFSCRTNYT